MERLFPLRLPRFSYAYWRILLLTCLALPLLEPWPAPATFAMGVSDFVGIEDVATSLEPPGAAARAGWQIPYLPLLAGVLAAGMLLRFSRLVVGALRLRRALQAARPVDLPWDMSRLAPGLGRRPRVCCVDTVVSPATYGLFRPVILLPVRFAYLTETQKLGVVCHELRHVQRHDWLFRLGEEVSRCVFWFHPLVLWLTRQIELSRQQSVDQEVVRMLGQSRDYLDSLLEMATARLSGSVAALFLSESYLRQRVRLIKEGFAMSTRWLGFSLAVTVVILATAGALAVWAFCRAGNRNKFGRRVSPAATELRSRSGDRKRIPLPTSR
ncbi:MAG: M56 family metallopeptidase [Acidobacteriota bacterium]